MPADLCGVQKSLSVISETSTLTSSFDGAKDPNRSLTTGIDAPRLRFCPKKRFLVKNGYAYPLLQNISE